MGLNSRYEIRVKGVLDGRWTAWFEDLQVSSDEEETIIAGPVADQAALLADARDYRIFLVRGGTEPRASRSSRPNGGPCARCSSLLRDRTRRGIAGRRARAGGRFRV
jgi:hypothetical protein